MIEDVIDLQRYLAMLRRWLWLIVLCTLLAAGTAYLVSKRQVPLYRASATLLIQPPSNSLYELQLYRVVEEQAPTYIRMLTGRPVQEAALARLGWDLSANELSDDAETSTSRSGSSTVVSSVSVGRVSAALIPDTQLVLLSVTDTDPRRAAAYANAVVDAFVEMYHEMQQGRYTESLAALQGQMDNLSAQMGEVQAQIDELGQPSNTQEQAESNLLQTTLAGYRNMYAILVRDYEQLQLAATQSSGNVAVYERARVPPFPLSTSTRRNTLLAGAVGAMLAVGVAFLIEYLDDTLKTPEDVKRVLELGTVGVIARMDENEGELVAVTRPLSPISEAFRKLRTNIRFSGLDRPLRTLLVTSATPSEGKSTVVANLSAVMAQAGLRTVALDADQRRPRLHQVFGLDPQGGLSGSLLAGAIDGNLQAVPAVDGLSMLAAGEQPPNPAEALGSQRMRDLLGTLTQQADVVLLDSPPVLPVTDAAVLSQAVDGVLLVVDAGHTRRPAAQQAVEELRRVGANLVGVVINKVPSRGGGHYYHGYHSYRAYYGERTQDRRSGGLWGRIRRAFESRRRSDDNESDRQA